MAGRDGNETTAGFGPPFSLVLLLVSVIAMAGMAAAPAAEVKSGDSSLIPPDDAGSGVRGGGISELSPISPAFQRRAQWFLKRHPVFDGHNDLAIAIRNNPVAAGNVAAYDLRGRAPGQTDLPRLKAGFVGAQLWSVYIPAEAGAGAGSAYARTQLEQIDLARQVVDRYPEALRLVGTAQEARAAMRAGRIASMLAMEGGYGLENSLGALRAYHALGVRVMGLTHNVHTDWADAAAEFTPKSGGLAPFGVEVVREMNRLGMVVDLSHAADTTARDALRVSRAPVIFSHGAARALCDIPRNTPDALLAELPRNGGVFMVTFVAGFVDCEVARATQPLMAQYMLRVRKAATPEARKALVRELLVNAKVPPTSIGKVADHIEHVRRVAGIDHVGLGGDFDGNSWWPVGLSDVSMYPNLIAELLRRGWRERDLAALTSGNLLRVLDAAEAVARAPPGAVTP